MCKFQLKANIRKTSQLVQGHPRRRDLYLSKLHLRSSSTMNIMLIQQLKPRNGPMMRKKKRKTTKKLVSVR